jgi:hypothetical protein
MAHPSLRVKVSFVEEHIMVGGQNVCVLLVNFRSLGKIDTSLRLLTSIDGIVSQMYLS